MSVKNMGESKITIDEERYDISPEFIEIMLAEFPDNILLLMKKGWQLFRRDNLPGALECFQKVLGLDPSHIEAHIWAGATLKMLGRVTESRGIVVHGLELDSHNARLWFLRADIATELGNRGLGLTCMGYCDKFGPRYLLKVIAGGDPLEP